MSAFADSRPLMEPPALQVSDLVPIKPPNMNNVVGLGYQPSILKESNSCQENQLYRHEGEPIPDFQVGALGMGANATLEDVLLQLITANKLPMQPSISSELKNLRSGNSLQGIAAGGKLDDVLEQLSTSMGFFYRLDKGVLKIMPTKSFELPLPAVDSYVKNVEAILTKAGATDIYVETRSKRAFFTANRIVADRIQHLVDKWPEDMSSVFMDISIHQVTFKDSDAVGINWDKFSITKGSGSATITGGGSAGTGALKAALNFNLGSAVSMAAIVDFLATQGTTRVLQQPKLSVVSGEEATLDATTKRPYAVATTTVSNGVSSTATEMKETALGLTATIKPFVRRGTVSADIEITMTELESETVQTIAGNNIPLIATRGSKSKATLRMRDGDAVVLSGIMTSRSNANSQGVALPFFGKVGDFSKASQTERSELVIIIRPHVVRYESEDGPCDSAARQ